MDDVGCGDPKMTGPASPTSVRGMAQRRVLASAAWCVLLRATDNVKSPHRRSDSLISLLVASQRNTPPRTMPDKGGLPVPPRGLCCVVAMTIRHLRSPEAKFEYIPQRLKPILPINLLPFGIGSSEVANAELINAKFALAGNLSAHLHFDAEIVSCQAQ